MSASPGPAMPAASSLFGDPAAIRCERAVAELRAGRPVLLHDGQGQRLAVIALDSATASSFATFASAARQRHYLFLTATRARVLGVEAPEGARLPLAGVAFDALPSLGYLREPGPMPDGWAAGDAFDAGAVELARLGLLLPAMVAVRLDADDSTFNGAAEVALCDLAEGAAHATHDYELVARSPVPLRDVGMTTFAVFRGGVAQRDQVAIIVGKPDLAAPVPVRLHSACLTGDLFGSLKCDCGDQLRETVQWMAENEGGILLYLDQEGRGNGISNKMRAYKLQSQGWDTYEADEVLGFDLDQRHFDFAATMLKQLGVSRVIALTNNPQKIGAIAAAGLEVAASQRVLGRPNAHNVRYLASKRDRAGHLIDMDALMARAAPKD